MTTRLPIPGSDDGTWGSLLNDFLSVSIESNGTLKANSVANPQLAAGSGSDGQVLTKDSTRSNGIKWSAAGGAGGVSSVNGYTDTVVLTKSDINLANADDTSDANKPISTDTQTALNAKAPLASPTFSGIVTVPTPSTGTGATTRDYVDTTWQGSPVYLTWNGSDYVPTALKATTSRPKVFTGPTDPTIVSGVILATYDEWNQTLS